MQWRDLAGQLRGIAVQGVMAAFDINTSFEVAGFPLEAEVLQGQCFEHQFPRRRVVHPLFEQLLPLVLFCLLVYDSGYGKQSGIAVGWCLCTSLP